jgi:hypothetical protein
MASMTAEWFLAHHLDKVLCWLLFTSGIYVVRTRTRRVRLWFIGAMAVIAVTCVSLIPFLP